ncbi:MAG: triose-phosphate isomerase [Pseudomonadota bacterium]
MNGEAQNADFWVGTSWKMNKTIAAATAYARALAEADEGHDARIQRFVIPPFTSARQVAEILSGSSVKTGAQNMHWADEGAWTGEISPAMLTDCGLDIVELGHSERRTHFGETDETVGLKTEAAVRHGLIPLICIGETLAEREAGCAQKVLAAQTEGALSKLAPEQRGAPILFAYEPVWAIGVGGIPATSNYADARQAEIIATAEQILGRRVPCLYGGSVDGGNCEELITCPHVDGLFIGRAALDVGGYLDILSKCAKAI